MRTSQKQFELLVEYMEKNGDLSKGPDGPEGRLTHFMLWKKLGTNLNSEITGSSKSDDKWRKVWSDFKNNTKKKYAKINGGKTKLVLTDLEKRVLSILKKESKQQQPKIHVADIKFLKKPVTLIDVHFPTSPASSHAHNTDEDASRDVPRPTSPARSEAHTTDDDDVEDPMKAGESGKLSPLQDSGSESSNSSTHKRRAAPSPPSRKARHSSPPSEPRKRKKLRNPSPQRPTVNMDPEQIIASDVEWRNLATEFVIENARLRRRELQQQAQWQMLFTRFLDILERIV